MFAHFETSSRWEREEIAAQLQTMYNAILTRENETFSALRRATPEVYPAAQIIHAECIGKLGAIQGVFEILGIEYESGQPFPV